MMKPIFSFVVILISFFLIDALWLKLMYKRFYLPQIGHLLSTSIKYEAAALFYLIYAIGLYILIVSPAIEHQTRLVYVFLQGALLGLVAYGTYDLTNQVSLKGWPWMLTFVDILWGSTVTGLVSVIATYLTLMMHGKIKG